MGIEDSPTVEMLEKVKEALAVVQEHRLKHASYVEQMEAREYLKRQGLWQEPEVEEAVVVEDEKEEGDSKEEVKDNEVKEGAGEVEAKEIETSKGEGFVELDKD